MKYLRRAIQIMSAKRLDILNLYGSKTIKTVVVSAILTSNKDVLRIFFAHKNSSNKHSENRFAASIKLNSLVTGKKKDFYETAFKSKVEVFK